MSAIAERIDLDTEGALVELRGRLTGDILTPDDAGYGEGRTIGNARI